MTRWQSKELRAVDDYMLEDWYLALARWMPPEAKEQIARGSRTLVVGVTPFADTDGITHVVLSEIERLQRKWRIP